MNAPRHRADQFVDASDDPREGGPGLVDERTTLVEFLRGQRLTLQLKCDGLTPEQLARRSVEPSTMSLLGLVRHLAHVERVWFRIRFAGHDVPRLYQTAEDPDGDFNGALADQRIVDDAWARWREEVAFAEQFTREHELDFVGPTRDGDPLPLCGLLAHMIEEYARHSGGTPARVGVAGGGGHADLLRERIDGRVGE